LIRFFYPLQWWKKSAGSSFHQARVKRVRGHRLLHLFALLHALGSGFVLAAERSDIVAFDIPRQRADQALILFAEQADVTFIFPFDEARRQTANALVGDFTLKQALSRLLRGTSLQPEFKEDGAVTVVKVEGPARIGDEPMQNNKQTLLSRLVAGFTAGLAAMTAAQAQEGEAPVSQRATVLETVLVTAQRREETSQEVPMSVMALSGEALEKIGFHSINDIADKVPSLSIQPDFEKASALKVYIRGVGQEKPANFERDNGVGIYLDDIYVGHGNGLATELIDIERIEVLAGPQGILYGRNTIGGAVKFISNKPTGEFGFKQTFDVGNYDLLRSVTTVDLDEFANISTKLTFLKSEKDGWVENTGSAGNPGERDATGFRAALRWAPTDALTVDYTFDWTEQDSISNYQQHGYPMFAQSLTNLQVFPNRQDRTWRPIDLDVRDDFEVSGHAVTASWDINDNLTLKSITGYREFESESLHDGAESYNVSTLVATDADQDQFSQEFLLSGGTEDGSILYHVGVYYFKEDVIQHESELVSNFGIASAINAALGAGDPIVPPALSDLKPFNTYDIMNESKAVYAQVTWTPDILEQRLTFDLGARYTEDDRELTWNKPSNAGTHLAVDASDSVSADSFDPAFTIKYQWTDELHTYFRYAQAYRSGGFDTGAERLQAFDSEELESWEFGLKSQLLDDRLLLNFAVFTHDYKDIQVQFFDPGLDPSEPPVKVTVNAAEASTDGAELEVKFIPVEGLVLSGAAAYLSSETTVANPFTGETGDRPLFNTPEWKYNLSAEYSFNEMSFGTLSALVTYDYRDEELAAGSSDPTDLKPDYGLLGARLSLSNIPVPTGELNLALWGKNLADEDYEVYHNFGSVIYGEPRSYGVSLRYQF
jgi:iron complex outermembrane receptor protein